MRLFIFAITTLILLTTNAWAEHEVDHRYNIHGYVLDENQQAIKGVKVSAFDGASVLATGTTDSDGYYSLHLHLHNEDNHRKLRLRAGTHEAQLRVTFDAKDLNTLRVHGANFVAGKFIEGELGRFRIPPWFYPVGGLLIVGIFVVMLEKRRKRKIKQKQAGLGEHHASSHRKSKKRRGKKH